MKNRGVQDILIACVDGLKGFPEAINTVFPGTEIQLCIIHLIRNTLRYIVSKDQKSFMKELRLVYSAPTEEAALIDLDKLEENWGKKYSLSIRTWRQNWDHAATFFKYPDEIKIIYTTNAVEAVHRQFRKVTKQRSIFPNDDVLKKMLFLVYRDISKKWAVMPVQNWTIALSHLSIIFEQRLQNVL